MSMTQPKTTLTSGQCAPLLHRSPPALPVTLPQPTHQVFLRRDLRQRADYFANHAFNRTRRYGPSTWRAPVAAGRLYERFTDICCDLWICRIRQERIHPVTDEF